MAWKVAAGRSKHVQQPERRWRRKAKGGTLFFASPENLDSAILVHSQKTKGSRCNGKKERVTGRGEGGTGGLE